MSRATQSIRAAQTLIAAKRDQESMAAGARQRLSVTGNEWIDAYHAKIKTYDGTDASGQQRYTATLYSGFDKTAWIDVGGVTVADDAMTPLAVDTWVTVLIASDASTAKIVSVAPTATMAANIGFREFAYFHGGLL